MKNKSALQGEASLVAEQGLCPFTPDVSYFQLRPWRAVLALGLDWGLIAASFAAVVIWPYWPVYLFAALMVARTQLALAVMMHESAHGLLLPQQWSNDVIGQAFTAGPLLLSMKTYRAGHLKHHQNPMVPDDPVAVVFQVNDYPISRKKLVLRLLTDLCGIGFFLNVLDMLRGRYKHVLPATEKSAAWKIWEICTMLLSHGVLLGGLIYLGHPRLYLLLWVLPSITLLPFMGRVRAIMEHAGLPAGEDQSLNARTIIRPSWQTFLFGPHGIHYHIEHHLYVRIPFYHLQAVHGQMLARQLLPPQNLYTTYGAILRDVSYPFSRKPS